MLKRVAIIGKPNVGKSKLFNRLTEEKHSIVADQPRVTRDRITLEVDWYGKKFLLTDTGGYTREDNFFLQQEVKNQTEIALNESDLIIFLISCKEGIDDDDFHVSNILKKKKIKNVVMVANKCDCNYEYLNENRLGYGSAIYISSEHGINTYILLNEIVSRLGISNTSSISPSSRFKLSVIGKPNVGKSTFVNSVINQNRIITSNIPGTTRDAIDLDFEFFENKYKIIDTPGIRKHASIAEDEIEKYSILRSKKSILRSDMVLFVLDISEEISELDERIGGILYDANIPTLIIANKWDLLKNKSHNLRSSVEKSIRKKFKFLNWAPIVFISALDKTKLHSIFRKIEEIRKEASKKIKSYLLSDFLNRVTVLFSVPQVAGRKIKLFSLYQIESHIPSFVILCNDPNLLHFSYARLIENQFRKAFDYKITPLTIIYKKK